MDLGLGSQKKPFLLITVFMLAAVLLYMFYIFVSVGTTNYMRILRSSDIRKHHHDSKPNSFLPDVTEDLKLAPKKGYLVWNPQCQIPDINPLHKSIRHFIKIEDPIVCSSQPPLTKIQEGSLVVVQDVVHLYDPKKKISCCFQEVLRNSSRENPDDVYWLSSCKSFTKSIKLQYEQFMMVKCSTTKGKKKEVYTNMHATVKITPEVKRKIEQTNKTEQKMSVLIVGFDSISRLNLIRTMPRTVLFLKSQGWVDLRGYNKMEDNTCPNFLAILTGLSPKRIRKYCFPKDDQTFDETPFIWKDYAEEGYITAYGEDEQWIGTFNYHKQGFREPPTDYYMRYYMLAAEKYMKIKKVEGLKFCLGPTRASDHVLNYAVEFATVFRNDRFFALFWMNSFSHNEVNTPSSMDRRVLEFFEELTASGTLTNTFVVFLSDHGMRFGPMRQTYVGWMEERLPFIYLWVPEWYREKYPQNFDNLVKNGDRLTSPYDLHLTLQHVLNRNKKTDSCPKCVSLFNQVPWNRSCYDAGISEHWCTCSDYRKIPTEDAIVKRVAEFIITEINLILSHGKHLVANGSTCASLYTNRILSVRKKTSETQENFNDYKIIFETSPGEAMFEASVRQEVKLKLLDTISRINMYDEGSKCVNDTFLKKYCHCVNE